ncbi:tetratricopeptide repeat protein [Rhodococcus koreensis]
MPGVPWERILLVRADLADGEHVSVGSGTLIAPRLALTAAHVVFDKTTGRPLSGVTAGASGSPDLVTARVLWPNHCLSGDSPGELDVALLEIDDPSWNPPMLGPVRWGRVTGRSPQIPCEATGFPRVLRDPDGTRESDQISGTINPGTGKVTGRHDITVTSAPPVTDPKNPSPWSGSSGAGVFCDGLLTAVLVIDTDGFGHGRLTAIPTSRILADDTALALVTDRDISSAVESVELMPLLRTGGRRDRARSRRGGRISPSMLLRADYEAVTFHGRDRVLGELTDWCTDPAPGWSVRLVIGPGGSGKTRLARRFVADLDCRAGPGRDPRQSWVAGFLDTPSAHRAVPLEQLADSAVPVLVVIDYAETRTEQVTELLRLLETGDGAPVRVLLLARAAGDWWDRLAREVDVGGPVGDVTELPALDDTPADRDGAFDTAVHDLAGELGAVMPAASGVDWAARAAAITAPPDLHEDRYGNPLTLQLAALLRLLDPHPSPTGRDGVGTPERDLLTLHEQKYWQDTAPVGLHLQPPVLAQAVTAATVCGAATDVEARDLLATLPGLAGQPANTLIAVDTWLQGLYPAPPGHRWGTLQPDRVGEHLTATTLDDNSALLSALLTTTGDPQRHQALTVLARTLANRTVPAQTRDRLGGQLREVFTTGETGATLAEIALEVATETAEPRPLIDAVAAVSDTFTDAQLEHLARQFPRYSLALADLAASVTTALVDRLRHTARNTDHPDTFLPDLAWALNNQSLRLADLGRREDALTAIDEAVQIHRELAEARPDAFRPGLALALTHQSLWLADLGRREDALTAIDEAVQIHRELAEARPDASRPGLALALTHRSGALAGLGRREDALTAIDEAVQIHRELAEARPDASQPDLAMALHNQSNALAGLGRREDALTAIDEAVLVYRELAEARPDASRPALAGALTNQSLWLGELGRREDALTAIDEAVQIHRELAEARPDAFRPALALALTNQSVGLVRLGRREDALTAIDEAIQIHRELAEARPDASRPDLAMALTNQSGALAELGRREDALTAGDEAVQIHRELAEARPDAFRPGLALALTNWSLGLAGLGRREDALTAIDEAVQIHRELAEARPDASRPDLAMALTNQSLGLAGLGRREDALTAGDEAVQIYRELAEARPDAFRPALAGALHNQSLWLGELGRREDALTAIDEAITIYRELAEARPDAFRPALAGALHNRSGALAGLGRREDALTAIDEAVQIYRELAEARPDAFRPALADALHNQSLWLGELGRPEDALTAGDEAITIYRELAEARPDASLPALAASLYNQSNRLAGLGRREDALTAIDEAITIYRELAEARPDLADSLTNQSVWLAELGRREDALTAGDEAVQTYRQLAAEHSIFLEDFAETLFSHGIVLTALGNIDAALSADREAVSVYSKLFEKDPERYRDAMERGVSNLAVDLKGLGRSEQEIEDELGRLSLPDAD